MRLRIVPWPGKCIGIRHDVVKGSGSRELVQAPLKQPLLTCEARSGRGKNVSPSCLER